MANKMKLFFFSSAVIISCTLPGRLERLCPISNKRSSTDEGSVHGRHSVFMKSGLCALISAGVFMDLIVHIAMREEGLFWSSQFQWKEILILKHTVFCMGRTFRKFLHFRLETMKAGGEIGRV